LRTGEAVAERALSLPVAHVVKVARAVRSCPVPA
jgi:hypothetical protein